MAADGAQELGPFIPCVEGTLTKAGTNTHGTYAESWIRFGKVTMQTIDLVVDDLMMDCTMVHMCGWSDNHGRKGDRRDARWMWPNCATIEHVDGSSRRYG